MKVIIRQVVDGEIEQVFSIDNPFDVQIEFGSIFNPHKFRIAQSGLALLVAASDGRIVISPSSSNTVIVTEVK